MKGDNSRPAADLVHWLSQKQQRQQQVLDSRSVLCRGRCRVARKGTEEGEKARERAREKEMRKAAPNTVDVEQSGKIRRRVDGSAL